MFKELRRAWTLVAVGIFFTVFMIYPAQADDGMDITTESVSEADIRFAEELAAADRAGFNRDRDSKVEHLRKALTYRPDHLENIAIEFSIGIELSQRDEPRPAEAMAVFERILATYRHMDYYSADPDNRYDSMQFLVPEAAVLAACIARGPNQNPRKAQEYLLQAMEHMNETYQKRIEDWKDARPQALSPLELKLESGRREESKRESQKHFFEQRRNAAANGNVLGSWEMTMVDAAVRQFGYSHGKQSPGETIVVMRIIVDKFPGTPMAKVAQHYSDKALARLDKELLDAVPERIMSVPPLSALNAETQPTTLSPSPTPPPGRDSQSNAQKTPGLAATITASLRTHYYAWLAGTAAVTILVVVVRYARKRRT